jgi:hypothetical protein
MAEYGFTWRFRTNPDGSGLIEGPISEPRRPLNLTLSPEEAQLLEAELDDLRADEQDDALKSFYAKRVHEEITV